MGTRHRPTKLNKCKLPRIIKAKTTMYSLCLLSLVVGSALPSPAPTGYSGVQPQGVAPARHTSPSISCRTEYTTIWDTKYVETETEVCTTEYDTVCRTEQQRLCQPTTRQVCELKYETQCSTIYKNVCGAVQDRVRALHRDRGYHRVQGG